MSRRQQQVYRRSDDIPGIDLPDPEGLAPLGRAVTGELALGVAGGVQRACQALADEIARQLGTPALEVRVHGERPSSAQGELHGLYTPDNLAPRARVELWMRTAKRGQVVAARTFLRTLAHEICHHVDYEHFRLPETFHTEGFYRRESRLLRQMLGEPTGSAEAGPQAHSRPGKGGTGAALSADFD